MGLPTRARSNLRPLNIETTLKIGKKDNKKAPHLLAPLAQNGAVREKILVPQGTQQGKGKNVPSPSSHYKPVQGSLPPNGTRKPSSYQSRMPYRPIKTTSQTSTLNRNGMKRNTLPHQNFSSVQRMGHRRLLQSHQPKQPKRKERGPVGIERSGMAPLGLGQPRSGLGQPGMEELDIGQADWPEMKQASTPESMDDSHPMIPPPILPDSHKGTPAASRASRFRCTRSPIKFLMGGPESKIYESPVWAWWILFLALGIAIGFVFGIGVFQNGIDNLGSPYQAEAYLIVIGACAVIALTLVWLIVRIWGRRVNRVWCYMTGLPGLYLIAVDFYPGIPLLIRMQPATSTYDGIFEASFILFDILAVGYIFLIYLVWKGIPKGGGGREVLEQFSENMV